MKVLVEIKKFGKEERVVVTSLDVAETFGKEYYFTKEELRVVQSMECLVSGLVGGGS